MKVLIIGGDGMAGHVIKNYFTSKGHQQIFWTTRRNNKNSSNSLYLDVRDLKKVEQVLNLVKPHIVINAVGILNDIADKNIYDSIFINSLFPHKLSEYSNIYNFYLIHISTDCVFSGKLGDYSENSEKTGSSVYAQTKSLGEVTNNNNLTIRTSIIGPELKEDGIGLFHWFMKQKGKIEGYQNVFWNGITTLELAKVIYNLSFNQIKGLIHLTGEKKISKYELLLLLKETFSKNDITILPSAKTYSDKSLIITRKDFKYTLVNYSTMIKELKDWMESRPHTYQQYLS
ncbi:MULTISPECIES: sugar nucleotide-binding protein [unclassified Priestia]|uniref:sugar nucleotide-binding protein n=1 Tax=unclassified Priestia TaxID=2800374 RepID=UPI00366C87C0